MSAQPYLNWRLVLIGALLVGVWTESAGAQGGRGNFRGFGGGGGFGDRRGGGGGFLDSFRSSPVNVIRNEAVQQELGLSESQRTAVSELLADESAQTLLRSFEERRRAAQSDPDREAIQAEMTKAFEELNRQREKELQKILDGRQFTRLQQISLQRAGVSALLREDVAQALGLTEAQRQQLTALNGEYDAARMELGFRASEEDRQKLREEWNAKFLAVLNETQRAAWTEKLGPPASEEVLRGFGGGFPGPRPPGSPASSPPVAAATPNANGNSTGSPATSAPPAYVPPPPPEGATVVSSFGAPPGEISGRTEEAATFSFNFRYAPWVDVLKLFADRAGLTLDLNTVPPGTFNYYDDGQYTVTQALDILNGYLLPKGYILVRRDRFLVCVNVDQPIPPNLVPHVDREELYQRGQNELMTVVFPLEAVNIDEVVQEISQLQVPPGKVVGLKASSSVAVTDIGSNLRRIDQLLQAVSVQPETVVFQAYPLKYIAADEAETSVRALLGLQVGVTDVSAGAGNEGFRGDPRDPRSFERSRESSRSTTASTTVQARIWAHLRTNSLMVTATPAQQKIVEAAIKVIDVDEQAAGVFARSRKPYLQVYQVTSSDPREVVKTLAVLVPGVVVNEDGRNGKIHIVATEAQHEEVGRLIRQLDGLGGGEQVAVIPLVKMDPVTAAAQLRTMFVRDGDQAPTIEPDLYGRQLMIRGNSTQLLQVQQILAKLGEDGTGVRRPGEGGVVRNFPLAGRDPAELLPLLQQAWENTSPTPIRIVRPPSRGPVNSILTPNPPQQPTTAPGEEGFPGTDPSSTQRSLPGDPTVQAAPRTRGLPIHLVAQTEVREAAEDETPVRPAPQLSDEEVNLFLDLLAEPPPPRPEAAAPPATEAAPSRTPPPDGQTQAPTGESQAPVTITVVGDELLISGGDPEALDRVEELLESMMQRIPPRTSWTIFPLENADVTTTAAMLNQLFPDSDVTSAESLTGGGSSLFSSLTGGINSMTSSLAGMTGLTGSSAGRVRMIPYPPDNSLFVSGPTHKVEEIYEMLKILDSGELSASLRERRPRMIPVRYAEVEDVYNILRDVYKDALETEQDRGARNAASMFAAMMGGGNRRGGDQNQQTQVAQLSLGIDRQTSQIIVSCSEAKYQEIRSLVESIDRSALEAKRTVRVVSLHNTSASQLTNTVSSLMPRVKVSSTGSGRSSTSTPSSGGGSGGPSFSPSGGGEGPRPDADQIRQFFEQRMRERMQQSGGGDSGGRPSFGGSPFGGRPSFGGSPFGGGGSPFGGGGGPFGGSRGGGDRGGGDRGGR